MSNYTDLDNNLPSKELQRQKALVALEKAKELEQHRMKSGYRWKKQGLRASTLQKPQK